MGTAAAQLESPFLDSSSYSPLTRSPLKYRPCRDSGDTGNTSPSMEVNVPLQSHSQSATYPHPIAQFQTTDQPISDVTLKEMLMSPISSIESDMVTCIQQCRAEVQELGDRVHQVETKMSEYTFFHTLVDFHTSQQEVISIYNQN